MGNIMSDWNSVQYLKFKKERTQPSIDLVSRIDIDNPAKIIDIGCGPANSTKILYDRFPNSDILGVDYSQNMIDKAREVLPQLKFELFDATDKEWSLDKNYDIVFTNACIQWIPNHKELLPKMMSLLKTNGVLAVQIPIQYNEPIHKIIGKVSSSLKWKSRLKEERPFHILSNSEYYDILAKCSTDFEMWTTTYYHRMKSHNDIIEWYKSTGLKPYLDKLNDTDKQSFIDDVYQEVVKQYPVQENGEVILRFPRLFFIARR